MNKILVGIPAYGRVYDSDEEILKDWEEGKDFKVALGPYFSIRDVENIKKRGYSEIVLTSSMGAYVTIPLE